MFVLKFVGENIPDKERERKREIQKRKSFRNRQQGYAETFQNCFYDVANRAPCRIQIHTGKHRFVKRVTRVSF